MTAEAAYEKTWSKCASCGCRRPPEKLTNGVCNDTWHERLVELAIGATP